MKLQNRVPRRRSRSLFLPVVVELTPGCRLQLLGDQFVRNNGGEAIVVADTDRLWRYRLRLDSGSEILVRLDSERFRLLRLERTLKNIAALRGYDPVPLPTTNEAF